MKKLATLSLAAALSLTLAACGGNSAENTTVTNDITLNADDAVVTDNLTAVDTLANDTSLAIDNAADATGNTLDAAGNTVTNAL